MTIHLGWALLLNSEPAVFTHAVVAVVQKPKKTTEITRKNPANFRKNHANTRKNPQIPISRSALFFNFCGLGLLVLLSVW